MIKNKLQYITMLLLAFSLVACKINYTFTGASISPEIKSVSIQLFPNQAPLVQPLLSNDFTEALKDKFIRQTSLELINGVGDLNFEGVITGYSSSPTSVQRETAAENRLTITVKVKFTNALDPKQNFESSFSEYEDYDSSRNLEDVESELLPQIIDKLIESIFNKSVANW